MSELSLTNEQQVSDQAAKQAATAAVDPSLKDWRGTMQSALKSPKFERALPLIGIAFVVTIAALAWLVLREPPQRDLFRGLPEDDKAAVAAALQKSEIPFSLDEMNGSLTVSRDDYHRAKMSLAAQGLPKSAPDGDSLISSMPMGSSKAVENEKLRTARELDLARTIEAIDSILSARVHLAVEAPSVFVRDRAKPSASIMVQLSSGAHLSDDQVKSIVNLVAGSVPGLSANAISIVDQNGRFMSQSMMNDASGSAQHRLSVQKQVEDRYRNTLFSLLTPIIGTDNFTAEVSAELDFSEKQATQENFPKEDAVVRSEKGKWSNDPGERPSYGIPGALSNRPPEDATVDEQFQGQQNAGEEKAGEKNSRTSEEFARQFELGREVSVTKMAPGSITRLSVAVALRSPMGKKQRSKEEISAVEALVKGAVGFNAERGDIVTVRARDFQPVNEVVVNWWESEWVSMLVRNLSALLVSLVLLFGIARPLLKRYQAKHAPVEPPKLESDVEIEIEQPQKPAEPVEQISLEMISSAQDYSERAGLIQNFVRQNPDHATLVVQDLLAEGEQKPGYPQMNEIVENADSQDCASIELSGTEAAAVLLMLFAEEEAASILARLEPEHVQKLGESMFAVANVSAEDVSTVFDRFVEKASNRTSIGFRADDQIRSMMKRALGPQRATNILNRIGPSQTSSSLSQLKWMSVDEITDLIREEHPQMMALVLSHLSPETAGVVLEGLSQEIQDDVVFRVATMGEVSETAMADLEKLIVEHKNSQAQKGSHSSGGTSEAAAIMNNISKQDGARIIKLLTKRNKEIGGLIEDEMFIFADLVSLDDKNLGTLLRSVENEYLIPALKGASPDLASKIFGCMSSRAAQSIQDEMEELGPLAKDEVIAAQKQVIATARAMAEEGTIILGGQGDDFI